MVVVGRGRYGNDLDFLWYWECYVNGCRTDSGGEIDGADAWPVALSEALAHLREEHGS